MRWAEQAGNVERRDQPCSRLRGAPDQVKVVSAVASLRWFG
jgi:hypothetical protein